MPRQACGAQVVGIETSLGMRQRHHFGMQHRQALRRHQIDPQRNEHTAGLFEHGGRERAAGTFEHIATRRLDHEGHAGIDIGCGDIAGCMNVEPVRQVKAKRVRHDRVRLLRPRDDGCHALGLKSFHPEKNEAAHT